MGLLAPAGRSGERQGSGAYPQALLSRTCRQRNPKHETRNPKQTEKLQRAKLKTIVRWLDVCRFASCRFFVCFVFRAFTARGGTRTHNPFRGPGPKPGASANSATLASVAAIVFSDGPGPERFYVPVSPRERGGEHFGMPRGCNWRTAERTGETEAVRDRADIRRDLGTACGRAPLAFRRFWQAARTTPKSEAMLAVFAFARGCCRSRAASGPLCGPCLILEEPCAGNFRRGLRSADGNEGLKSPRGSRILAAG